MCQEAGTTYLSRGHGFNVFEEVHVARLFSLLCYVFCFVCLRPVCSILPVSLDFPFSIYPSVFSCAYTKYG
jgi:hypothetical protein